MLSTFTITLLGATSRLLRGAKGLLRAAMVACGRMSALAADRLMRQYQDLLSALCYQYSPMQPVSLATVVRGSDSDRFHSLRPTSHGNLFVDMLKGDREGKGTSGISIVGWSKLEQNLEPSKNNWSGRIGATPCPTYG
jgi:hypothetical protein